MDIIAVLTTTDSRAEAQTIASALVERKLAACVQISSIDSVYTWEGATHNDPEHRLLIKTTRERYPNVESAIIELHSYELPAVIAIDISHAYTPFAEWVAGSVE